MTLAMRRMKQVLSIGHVRTNTQVRPIKLTLRSWRFNTFYRKGRKEFRKGCKDRDTITFASKREQSRIYSSYAEREQNVRIKLRLNGMVVAKCYNPTSKQAEYKFKQSII